MKLKPGQIDFSNELKEKAFPKLKKGQTLTFNKQGTLTDYKIVRLNRAKKICIIEPIELTEKIKPEDVEDRIERHKASNDNTTTSQNSKS